MEDGSVLRDGRVTEITKDLPSPEIDFYTLVCVFVKCILEET